MEIEIGLGSFMTIAGFLRKMSSDLLSECLQNQI
jgi:hypothetical protein